MRIISCLLQCATLETNSSKINKKGLKLHILGVASPLAQSNVNDSLASNYDQEIASFCSQ
jgi:hypothetical protein